MISINLAPDQVSSFLSEIQSQGTDVSIACINSPLNVTLSGPESKIDAVKAKADGEGIFSQKLQTGVAYHSSVMSHVAEEYLALMGNLEPSATETLPMVSTVTGKMIKPLDLATGEYWVNNMVSPVKFATTMRNLMESTSTVPSITDFVEIGPHPALRRCVQDTLGKDKMRNMQYLSALYRGRSAAEKTLELAGTLFCRGHSISLTAVNNQQRQGEGMTRPFLIDCPPYPFDHSKKFWAESRISRDYRLRTPTKGEVLGQRTSDWNPLQPRWRSFLSVETHPWIGHHIIGNEVLYPAAGMLVMALEAAQEMVPAGKKVEGYLVREAHFMSPVVIPEHWDDRVELMLSLQPVNNHRSRDPLVSLPSRSTWFDIRIFLYAKESHSWTEVFRSNVQVHYTFNSVENTEKCLLDEAIRVQHHQALQACTLPIDSQLMYSDAAEHGLQYGEWFQLCRNIRWDKEERRAVASVPVSNNTKFKTTNLVHPAVLDTAFHVLRVSAGQQPAANVPVQLENAWFASSGWHTPATGSVSWLASSRRSRKVQRGEQGSVSALADDGTVLTTIARLVTAAVSRTENSLVAEKKKLLYGIEWKPQLSMLSPEQLSQACKADVFPIDESIMLAEHRRRTAVLNVVAVRHVRNIFQLEEKQRSNLNGTLRHHADWMQHYVRSLTPSEREAAGALTDDEVEDLLESFAAAFPSWTLYPHVARSLPAIISGEVDPLQVIFESDHAKTFYTSLFHTVCGDGRLSRFLDLMSHENPSLRILEVGAGTGGMTVHILNSLKEREKCTGALAFAEYMYTDISPVFFEAAKARWLDKEEGFSGRMSFKTLDMERSVSAQGFAENSYDLLIAGSCVHATALLDKTLWNLRRLLRPGGKLVLLEVTNPFDIATCFFATLASGWWLSREEWRIKNKSPLASEEAWDELLRNNGFSGNDLVLRDTREAEAHIVSVIVSTAVEENKELESIPKRVFIINDKEASQKELAEALRRANGRDVILPLSDVSSTLISRDKDDIIISLLEVGKPFLASISETQFLQLQNLIKHARSLLWVTAPENGSNDISFPLYAIAQGFLRTIRAELTDRRIVSLAIEEVSCTRTRADFINTTLRAAFGSSPAAEFEYIVRSGKIHTGRAVEIVSANNTLCSLLSPRLQHLSWKDSPALKLALGALGSIDSLHFEQDETHCTDRDLDPNQVEIEAQAWGLTQEDVLAALGRLDGDDSDDFGTDCSGIVTQVGSECKLQTLKPGDHVVMLSPGCIRKFPRAHESRVLKICSSSDAEGNLSFETAAATVAPALTAYRALLDVAKLEQGEKVLIHEAASATGQMAVQIAKMQGAEVFVTTCASFRSQEKEEEEKQFLVYTLGIAPGHIFSARDNTTSFASGVRRATGGYGVDIVINSLTGEQAYASWELLAPGGRFVSIGHGELTGWPLSGSRKNTSSAAVDVQELHPQATARLLENTMALLNEGKITPPTPVRVFPATDVKEAFRALQNGEHSGRVVITAPRPNDVIPQVILNQQQPRKLFHKNTSYLVPGGLGGLGRCILAWMAARGAKNLIVPSRSGVSSPAAAKLVSTLRSKGVDIITPRCNIANEVELAALLEDCRQTMPPIRGVINCAMVLANAMFANMSFQQWTSAIQAKIGTSLNLHRLLRPDGENFDFFIHLSSLAGINGQMASANYAAGCTFQDALAGCYPGVVALDVGWMADVGLIAETAAYQRQLKEWGNMQRVEEREFLGVLGMLCFAGWQSHEQTLLRRQRQLLVGLLTPVDYQRSGKEPPPALLGRPFLFTFSQQTNSGGHEGKNSKISNKTSAAQTVIDHAALFRAAPNDQTRESVVATGLAEKLARAMMMSVDDVDHL